MSHVFHFAVPLLFFMSASAKAGPWTRGPGEHYAKVGEGLFVAEGYRDAHGVFRDESTYVGLSTFGYGEVGLAKNLQAQFYLPFGVYTNFIEPQSGLSDICTQDGQPASRTSRTAFGDAMLGLQGSSPWLSTPHAMRVNVKVPLYGMYDQGDPCSPLYAEPGDGQLDVDVWLSLGNSLSDLPLYVFGEVGHRFRTEVFTGDNRGMDLGDTFLFSGQLGWGFMEDGYLMSNLNLALPYVEDEVTKGSLTVGPGLYFPLGNGWAFETVLDATVWTRNGAGGKASRLFLTGGGLGLSHQL